MAQGGAATFVITASQPVVKNTSVNFAVQGTAQPGQDYEPLVGAALLRAGQSTVTVVLQSLRTDVTFEPTDMIVGSGPPGSAGLRQGRGHGRRRVKPSCR